jgi:hypothetical protein
MKETLVNIKQTVIYKIARAFFEKLKKFMAIKTAAEKEYIEENKKDKRESRYPTPVIEQAINEFKRQKGVFGSFALAESSVRCFLYSMLQQKNADLHICEFGGGQSTIFWGVLAKYVDVTVTTYEHDPEWAQHLTEQVDNKRIRINSCELMQIDEARRIEMFNRPEQSIDIWRRASSKIAVEQYKNPTLSNGFYNITNDQFPVQKINAIVLDGPHGNGRSMCFPLFYAYIESGTLILLDDYHHYPFLEDLGKLYKYEVVEKRRYLHSNKGWVVLKIVEKKKLG